MITKEDDRKRLYGQEPGPEGKLRARFLGSEVSPAKCVDQAGVDLDFVEDFRPVTVYSRSPRPSIGT